MLDRAWGDEREREDLQPVRVREEEEDGDQMWMHTGPGHTSRVELHRSSTAQQRSRVRGSLVGAVIVQHALGGCQSHTSLPLSTTWCKIGWLTSSSRSSATEDPGNPKHTPRHPNKQHRAGPRTNLAVQVANWGVEALHGRKMAQFQGKM